jgi:hypothetical protein
LLGRPSRRLRPARPRRAYACRKRLTAASTLFSTSRSR